jgi:hypothetical protein
MFMSLLKRNRFVLVAIFVFVFLSPSKIEALDIENSLNMEFSWADLQKEESRLRENHWGDQIFDGPDLQTSLYSRIAIGDSLSVVLMPTQVSPREGRDLFFRKGYLRFEFWNVALKIGRDSLWWGPGRHGALLVSNNAFPFDLIHVGSASPFFLPGFLAWLGKFEVEGFLTRLEENRDFSNVRLLGLRLIYHPREEITIGISRMTMFGGEGRPELSLIDFGRLYFSDPNRFGKFEMNELGGVDVRLRLPISDDRALELYGEYGGEDEAGFRPSKPALLVGLEWVDAGRRVLVEYANNHVSGAPDVWYTHSLYTSGYTYRGNIIGHPMGSDAKDLYLRMEWPFTEGWTGGVDFEQQNRHLSSPVQEKIRRWGGEVAYSAAAENSYSARLVYEEIENLNLLPENEQNVFAILNAAWSF